MAALSTSAIIVIVIVACLVVVSIGAALTRHLNPTGSAEARFNPPQSQEMYMQSVRQQTRDRFRRISAHARDVESQYDNSRAASYYISSDNMTGPQFSTPQLSTAQHPSSTQFSVPYA